MNVARDRTLKQLEGTAAPGTPSLPLALKRNAFVTLALAALFYWAFMFAKHYSALRNVIPFGEDPYDAVGSFAVVVGMLLAAVSLMRAFRPYYKRPPTPADHVYLLRSQVAVVLCVCITVVADFVALARHPSMWASADSKNELLALLAGLSVAAIATLFLLRRSEDMPTIYGLNRWKPAIVVSSVCILILATYPERIIRTTSFHLLAVVIGAVILFAPMRPILTIFVPNDSRTGERESDRRGRRLSSRSRWMVVVVIGIFTGAFAFIAEMSEDHGHRPFHQYVIVGSVFVGLMLAGFVIAFAFLGKPLGFIRE